MAPFWCSLCNCRYNTHNTYKNHTLRDQHRWNAFVKDGKCIMVEIGLALLLMLALAIFSTWCVISGARKGDNDMQMESGPELVKEFPMPEEQSDIGRASEVDPENKSTPEFEVDDSVSSLELKTDDEFKYATEFVPELPPPDFEPNSQVIVYLGGQKNLDVDEEL